MVGYALAHGATCCIKTLKEELQIILTAVKVMLN